MENVKPLNKRGDIGILQGNILWEWWCDIGYSDYGQTIVVLACDVGLWIECLWWPNRYSVMWLGRGVADRLWVISVGWASGRYRLPMEW